MDIKFSPEEESFRQQARAWLETNKPKDPPPENDLRKRREYDLAWQRRMYDGGWAGISWPKEFGGRGASLMEQLIWYEEFARARAHEPSTLFVGLNHGGPTLIACASDEQKAYHLPRILRGDVVWCQGFSEPGAGSDLAALNTRAVIDGDHLVVSGQKVWTSFAQIAEWQELLVRTDPQAPRHKGISWVVCAMDSPGITIRPIRTMAGHQDFCEVFYDEVRIPLTNVVGGLNNGWKVAMSTLSFERGTAFLAEQVRLTRLVEDLIGLAKATPWAGQDLERPGDKRTAWQDDEIRRRLLLARAQVEALRAMTYRSVSRTLRTGMPSSEASLTRLFFSELQQRVHGLSATIVGPGLLEFDLSEASMHASEGASLKRMRESFAFSYLLAFSSTIAAGSKDIQRNIIGERVLGLPR